MNDSNLKILVVSNHPLMYQGVVHVLRDSTPLDVCGTCFDKLEPATCLDATLALCVFLPGISPESVRSSLCQVRSRRSDILIACIFYASDDSAMAAAVNAGATGLFEETLLGGDLDPGALVECIERVARGEFVASAAVALRLARLHSVDSRTAVERARHSQLTPREQEVLELLAQGKSNRDIAIHLSVSEHTIRSHVRGLMHKLQVSNRIQAAVSVWRGQQTTSTN